MKYIDLSAAVQERFPGFYKHAPRFVLRFLEWIITQKRLNDILERNEGITGTRFHENVIKELNLTVVLEGKENLPDHSKCFFAANHPYGVIDGMILTKTVGEKYADFKAIGNDAFMLIPNLRPHIAMVNVYGHSSKENITELQKLYDSDIAITHFPAGEVSRWYKNLKSQDREWQKSFISKAISSQRDIVPFYFYGRNSLFFHLVNIIRRIFFIKTNLELILLPREIFNKKGRTIRVKIGKPISWKQFDSSHTHLEWAQIVRSYVYSLKNSDVNNTFFK
jgi:putative hemolysin